MSALGGCDVFEINDAFPRCFHAERVTISFGEAVDEIYQTLGVFEPLNRIVVEGAEVARAVVFDETTDNTCLLFIFCKRFCSFEMLDDLLDGCAVETTHTPNAFFEETKFTTHQTRVQAHHHRTRIASWFALCIELLCLSLGHIVSVVVACAGEHEVVAIFLIDTHFERVGIEHSIEHFVFYLIVKACKRGAQPFLRKFGNKLFVAVVVMDASREPHALEIERETLEIF